MYICDITLFYDVSLLICDTEINQSIKYLKGRVFNWDIQNAKFYS